MVEGIEMFQVHRIDCIDNNRTIENYVPMYVYSRLASSLLNCNFKRYGPVISGPHSEKILGWCNPIFFKVPDPKKH